MFTKTLTIRATALTQKVVILYRCNFEMLPTEAALGGGCRDGLNAPVTDLIP